MTSEHHQLASGRRLASKLKQNYFQLESFNIPSNRCIVVAFGGKCSLCCQFLGNSTLDEQLVEKLADVVMLVVVRRIVRSMIGRKRIPQIETIANFSDLQVEEES